MHLDFKYKHRSPKSLIWPGFRQQRLTDQRSQALSISKGKLVQVLKVTYLAYLEQNVRNLTRTLVSWTDFLNLLFKHVHYPLIFYRE